MTAFTITLRPDETFSVDLRELHAALESKQEFANWAKAKLAQFVEGQDFGIFDNPIKKSTRGRPQIDYAVTVECAKHNAMMEQTDRGRAVRQYFIACEAELQARATALPPAPGDPAAMLAAKMASFAIAGPGDVATYEAMAVLHQRLAGHGPRPAPQVMVKPPRPEPKLTPERILALIPAGGIRVCALQRLACGHYEASRALFYRVWRAMQSRCVIYRDGEGKVYLPNRFEAAG